MKKTVFVHDRIYHIWWAEKVFVDIIKHSIQQDINKGNDIKWSDYLIYTLFSDKKNIKIKLDEWYSSWDKSNNPNWNKYSDMDNLLDEQNQQAILKEDGLDVSKSDENNISNEIEININTTLPRWIFNIFIWFEKKQISYLSKLFDYRNLMFFYKILIWISKLDIKKLNTDKIVISSFAVVKNILNERYWHENNISTLLYLHSPYMFLWNHFDKNKSKLSKFVSFFYDLAKRLQTNRDLKTLYADEIKYNSFYTKSLIDKIYYGKIVSNTNKYDDNFIRYPKVDKNYLDINIDNTNKSDYFIYIWRIVRFSKELDKIIWLFNQNKKNLYIIWSGPDEEYLKLISWENITFCGYISDPEEKIRYMKWARWCINLTLESFWLVNIESLLCGTPVFWYDKWWTREIVDDQEDISYLVKNLDQESLVKEFEIFDDNIDNWVYKVNILKQHWLSLIKKYCNW